MLFRKTRFDAEIGEYGILDFRPENYIHTPQQQLLRGYSYEGKQRQDPDFLTITDHIPAQLTLTFGISFYLLANNSHREKQIELTTRVLHPRMVHPETQQEASSFSDTFLYTTPYYQYLFFRFEYSYELVRGTWTFQVQRKGDILLEKIFELT